MPEFNYNNLAHAMKQENFRPRRVWNRAAPTVTPEQIADYNEWNLNSSRVITFTAPPERAANPHNHIRIHDETK